ncbi:hypothetical protein [uncultured Rikenella sp.]|uniref:hypothetical protein n=1 Tax=uncultured Rikenella sp. TaxID=368003 RepID=UPI0025DD5B3C|nr:hypothetical protein [uncultured Rikenella sp.]
MAAPGYRDAGQSGLFGISGSVGNAGYSRSSSISGTDGMHLDFGVAWIEPSSAHHRGHGLQLRCLSE